MGQCVASCGSERQVDSVPQTPDSEILPSLVATSPSLAIAALARKYNHPDRVYPSGSSNTASEISKLKTHILPSSDCDMNDSVRRFNSPKHRNKNFSNKSVTFIEPEGNRKLRKPLISFNRSQVRTPSTKKHPLKKSSLQQSSYLLSSKLISNDNIINTVQPITLNSEKNKEVSQKEEENCPSNANGFKNSDDRENVLSADIMGNASSSYVQKAAVLTEKPVDNLKLDINETIQGHVDNIELDQNGNCKDSLKNLHAIREETKLLRERFFSPEPPKILSSALVNMMNRPNRFGYKCPTTTTPNKPAFGSNVSVIPKLYSITNSQATVHDLKKDNPGPNSKETPNSNIQKKAGNIPVSKFRINPALARLTPVTQTSASTGRPNDQFVNNTKPGSIVDDKNPIEQNRGRTPPCQRRPFGTFGNHTALRASRNETESMVKRTIYPTPGTATTTSNYPNRYGVKKPEETRPFYTIGLYKHTRSTQEIKSNSNFAVHSSGFQNVSTGLVKEKTLQYQTKAGIAPKKTAPTSAPAPVMAQSARPIPPLIRSTTWTKSEEEQLKSEHLKTDCTETDVPNSKIESREDLGRGTGMAPLPFSLQLERNHSSDSFSGSHSRPISISSREDHDTERHTTTTTETESSEETEIHDARYPIRHDASGASSLAASGHADNVISDSEFLIDDEISDQPDLTLTFKDSSVILSPSSSGESLVSCDIDNMLDLKERRNFVDLTSDSAISDVSSHKPSSIEQIDWTVDHPTNHNSVSKIKNADEGGGGGNKTNMKLPSSQIPLSTPLSSKPNKASFRSNRIHQNQITLQNQKSTRTTISSSAPIEGRNFQKPISNTCKPVSAIPSTVSARSKASTEKRPTFMKQNQNRTTPVSTSSVTTNLVPLARQQKDRQMGMTASKEGLDTGKTPVKSRILEAGDSEPSQQIPCDILEKDLAEVKERLMELQIILEANERRDIEKDELILQLTAEIALLKGKERIVNSPKTKMDYNYLDNENRKMANVAVQTENNNIVNKAVTYPDENDKLGQLVSFRIGRFSTSTKKS